ncbi:hypothetical protein BRI6_1100 [plant metagenome]|uniref:Uncharacterized protein n=1 Tax=plant metagenome TaxID=1297885 RepID=A0A484RYT3_9ZZZZ
MARIARTPITVHIGARRIDLQAGDPLPADLVDHSATMEQLERLQVLDDAPFLNTTASEAVAAGAEVSSAPLGRAKSAKP